MISEELRKNLISNKKLDGIHRLDFNELIDEVLLRDDINLKDNEGWSLLYYSAFYDLVDFARVLLNNGIDANSQTIDLETPLIEAVLFENYDMVKLLLQYGADPNMRDVDGCSALDYARNENYKEIFNLLSGNCECEENNFDEEEDIKEQVKRFIKM